MVRPEWKRSRIEGNCNRGKSHGSHDPDQRLRVDSSISMGSVEVLKRLLNEKVSALTEVAAAVALGSG